MFPDMRITPGGSTTGTSLPCGSGDGAASSLGIKSAAGKPKAAESGSRAKLIEAKMSGAVLQLLEILDLERIEENIFRGRSPQTGWQRVFGGLVVAQALVASARTVDGRAPHSLHGYFLLAGDPSVPIVYEVDRIRDGKSFTTRRCNA